MEEQLEEFRKAAERAKAASGRIRYSEEMRSFAVRYAKGRIGRGSTVSASAKELGVAEATLNKWLKRNDAFRQIQIRPDKSDTRTVTLITPNGYRLEGLDIESAASILRAIG